MARKVSKDELRGMIKSIGDEFEALLIKIHPESAEYCSLLRQYKPGKIEIADAMLAIYPDDVYTLESEIIYAKEQGLHKRLLDLAKRFVDIHTRSDHQDLYLSNIVEKISEWGDREIAEYAIKKFSQGVENEVRDFQLKCAIEIAEAFGRKDMAKKCLEDLLEVQKDDEFPFASTETLVKLGRYDEAIDLKLKYSINKGYGEFHDVLAIVREHRPQRLQEVAKKAFESFNPQCGWWDIFTECAEILGKNEEAKKRALESAKKNPDYGVPREYTPLVRALVKFGYISQAKELVADAEEHERARDIVEIREELAELFFLVGDAIKAKDEYLRLINITIRDKWNPLNTKRLIDRAYEVTKNEIFLYKKLKFFRRNQQFMREGVNSTVIQPYLEAIQLATKLGDNELANAYRKMIQMREEDNPDAERFYYI